MSKKFFNTWEPLKRQIAEIIFPAYTVLSKRCDSYINELEYPLQYTPDMLRVLADGIITSYPKFKVNSSDL